MSGVNEERNVSNRPRERHGTSQARMGKGSFTSLRLTSSSLRLFGSCRYRSLSHFTPLRYAQNEEVRRPTEVTDERRSVTGVASYLLHTLRLPSPSVPPEGRGEARAERGDGDGNVRRKGEDTERDMNEERNGT